MMKRIFFTALCVLAMHSCSSDDEVNIADLVDRVLISTRGDSLIADGSDLLAGLVVFNEDAVLDKIDAKISLMNASFESGSNDELKLTPEQLPSGRIVAEFEAIATTIPGRVGVTLNVNGFTFRESTTSIPSNPASISLSASASSALNNFIGEVTLEGNIRNENGRKVSNGIQVKFTDLLSDGSSAAGAFRLEQLVTGSESKVSAIYSPGLIAPDQFVTIIAELFDRDGDPLGIVSEVEIYVYGL